MLKKRSDQISMDGKGRWLDNVFVERLWRSVKYEEVYLGEGAENRERRARGPCALTSTFTIRGDRTAVWTGRRLMSSTSLRCRRPGRQPER